MIACIDTYYTKNSSRTGIVLFENWTDSFATRESVVELPEKPAEYIPGRFFLRELPSILAISRTLSDSVATVIIDGYVWLDQSGRKGLGALFHEAVGRSMKVIGVAKSRYSGSAGVEILRGKSNRPLFITSAGIDESEAALHIQSMHGKYRIPTLLKRADYLSRHGESDFRPFP